MPPPTKNRSAPGPSPTNAQRARVGPCACVSRPGSSGICELDIWYGTTVDSSAGQDGRRLLRPGLSVVKRKAWEFTAIPVHLHNLVALGWIRLLGIFIGVYVAVVGIFALLLGACHGVNDDNPNNARNLFNLSLQTLSTVGFGTLHPGNACANWIAVLECFISMLLTSFMTGVFFVKFARPHPNIVFSDVFTISLGTGGGQEMRFRVANKTRRDLAYKGDILDVNFKLILMRVETGRHGEKNLCYYDLKLETARLVSLRLEIEIVHQINSSSPLFNRSFEEVASSDFLLVLIASGLDENLHDTVHNRQEYGSNEIRWGAKFLPMLGWNSSHTHIELDLDKISSCEVGRAIDIDAASSPVHGEGVETLRASPTNEVLGYSDNDFSHLRAQQSRGDELPRHLRYGSTRELGDCDNYGEEATTTGKHGQNGVGNTCSSPTHERRGAEDRNTADQLNRENFTYPFRNHELVDSHDEPRSLLQRRVRVTNRSHRLLSNGIYHRALGASWPMLLFSLAAVYIAAIAVIALLISILIQSPLSEETNSSFALKYENVFFFCVQIVSTVGYGALSPRTDSDAVNFFVFLLVIDGILTSTLLTGVTWSKFSIPKASSLLYSDALLLTTFHSHRAIMFRAANNRRFGVIVEGTFRMSVVVLNRHLGRRDTHELKLVRNVWPIIRLCNTVTHIIDESSPLYHLSTRDLLSGDHFFVVLFTGLDNITSDTLVARKAYHACDILVDHHFEDNIQLTEDGLCIDLNKLNNTVFTPNLTKQPSEQDDGSNSECRASMNETKEDAQEAGQSPCSNFVALTD